jgi:uncharacterized protein (TIGR02246 family)
MCGFAIAKRLTILSLVLISAAAHVAQGQTPEDAVTAALRKSDEKMVAAFNAGKIDELAGMFLPTGEMIDEAGTVYQGQQEIKDLLKAFFEKFAGAKLALDVESVRVIGPVAIEEGTRTITSKSGDGKSQFRYIAVRAKTDAGWQIASLRDFVDDQVPTAQDNLEPLAWLVGDWVNEGADAKVAISYRWSEDKNYLLGEFQIESPTRPLRKSTQRIGWDPSVGKIRSWLFDADGGFAEAYWTVVEDNEIVIKSTSVNPEGDTSTATLTLVPKDKDHYSILGTERIVGENREPDFDITVSRRPPVPGK